VLRHGTNEKIRRLAQEIIVHAAAGVAALLYTPSWSVVAKEK
jgi:hypothetical protein